MDQSPLLPASVVVRFPAKLCASDPSTTYPSNYIKTISLASAGFSTPAGGPFPRVFHEAALALYQASGGPTNGAALDALALQVARDYYQWNTSSFDRVYNGVLSPIPTGIYHDIIIDYSVDSATTRLQSAPYRAEPEELMHHDPANAACTATATPSAFVYGPGAAAGSYPVFALGVVDGRLALPYARSDSIANCGCQPPCTTCIAPVGPCNDPNGPFLLGASASLWGFVQSSGLPFPASGLASGCCLPASGMVPASGYMQSSGAFLQASANNTLYCSGVIGDPQTPLCCVVPYGVYLLHVEAPGYDDYNQFVYSCTSCTQLYCWDQDIEDSEFLYQDDADYSATLRWLDLEACERTGSLCYPDNEQVFYPMYWTPAHLMVHSAESVLWKRGTSGYFNCTSSTVAGDVPVVIYFGCASQSYPSTSYNGLSLSYYTTFINPDSDCSPVGGATAYYRCDAVITSIITNPFQVAGYWPDYFAWYVVLGDTGGAQSSGPLGPGTDPSPPLQGNFTLQMSC